ARNEAELGLGSGPSEVLGLKTDAGGVTRNTQSRSARATRRIGLWAESDYPPLEEVRDFIASHNLPPIKQRKFNGIFNVMEMQIEDDNFSPEAFEHLEKAVISSRGYRYTF
ncbi:hypothetical protein C2W62_38900, partial [Candidatus Entotheonella serta]